LLADLTLTLEILRFRTSLYVSQCDKYLEQQKAAFYFSIFFYFSSLSHILVRFVAAVSN